MRVAVLGTRGFPGVQGGVEAHCENLYPRLAAKGCEVIVFGRKPYMVEIRDSPHSGTVPVIFKGVKIIPLSCPKNKFLEAFWHTFKGTFAAKKMKPDILHIHAIGPTLFVPLARLLGLKVVMTHHGLDYERKKWGLFAKLILRLGEILGCSFANEVITVSKVLADDIKKKYRRSVHVIPNGVIIPQLAQSESTLEKYGLIKDKYILAVGRFVPEKGFDNLIEAFQTTQGQSPKNGDSPFRWKLVIAGDADHEDAYSRQLKEKAKNTPNVVLTGFLSGQPLQELYSYAGLFVLPSYYEGLPIVLLEAMSYGLSCIVSDIPANRNVELSSERYFNPGDVQGLADKIKEFIAQPLSLEEQNKQVRMIAENYNWEVIAEKTVGVYKGL
ncbi:MAG: glycosyltransferase family 4 protein [Candidatus Omnitrophota bacterium]|nr:glycosyltransferase family 4 protein [Candidatus Omnitrophota bacterium]